MDTKLNNGVQVMLTTSIDKQHGLCKGTMLHIRRMSYKVVEAQIVSGLHADRVALIPRLRLKKNEWRSPFDVSINMKTNESDDINNGVSSISIIYKL